jgi:hypothetical protein
MSLSAREQRALDSITDRLVGSNPELEALLTGFTRLVSAKRCRCARRSGLARGGRSGVPVANGGTVAETKYTGP